LAGLADRSIVTAIFLALAPAAIAGPLEDAQTALKNADYATALKLLRPLAEHGEPRAETQLGLLYFNGYGVAQDERKATTLYCMAADRGDPLAQYLLGVSYEDGEGVPQDYDESVKWYSKAAEQGFLAAQKHLGLVYHDGTGVRQNDAEAAKWFRMAANQGDASAQNLLGVIRLRAGSTAGLRPCAHVVQSGGGIGPVGFD
jgi:TPR repeat protein